MTDYIYCYIVAVTFTVTVTYFYCLNCIKHKQRLQKVFAFKALMSFLKLSGTNPVEHFTHVTSRLGALNCAVYGVLGKPNQSLKRARLLSNFF